MSTLTEKERKAISEILCLYLSITEKHRLRIADDILLKLSELRAEEKPNEGLVGGSERQSKLLHGGRTPRNTGFICHHRSFVCESDNLCKGLKP